jgi:acyl dehydratase
MRDVPDELEPVSLLLDAGVVRRYGEVAEDFNPIHFEDVAAQALGLPGAIAHGMIGRALLSRLLARNLGDTWLRVGVLDVKFVRPAMVGETLTARGHVRSRSPLTIDVVVQNGDGEPVIVGSASVGAP